MEIRIFRMLLILSLSLQPEKSTAFGATEYSDTGSNYEYDYVDPARTTTRDRAPDIKNKASLEPSDCVSEEAKRNKRRDEKDSTFLNEMLESYDQRIRPNNNGVPVRVNISIFVNSFYSINEQTMDYKLNIFLRLRWNDPRLAHTSHLDAVPIHPSMLERIWKPDVFFSNEKHANFHTVTTENKLLRVYRNGDVASSVRLTLTLSCAMHLQNFPMDIQICKMELESFGFDMKHLIFDWDGLNAVQLPPRLALPQFLIRGYKLSTCTKLYSTGSFTCLGAQFILQRQMGYYVIQMYAPSLLIVILSWVAFWINMDAAPARTALGITTVLTMTTQSSGARASLPKVSYVKAIDVWFAVCLVFVFAALLEFAVVNFLSRQEKEFFKLQMRGFQAFRRTLRPRRARKEKDRSSNFAEDPKVEEAHGEVETLEPCYSMIGRLPERKQTNSERFRWKAKRIDQISRVCFPLVFVVFNLFYWIIYQVDRDDATSALEGAIMYSPL